MCRSAFASRRLASKSRSTDARIHSMSAPAEKLGPSPARTTARARPTSTNVSASSAMRAASNAFRTSGRASVTRRISSPRSTRRVPAMARIVVAGAGAIGASVAYHLALAGARDVVLCDRGEVAGGSTGRAMGGVRQQFSTAAEVRLAQESLRFFEELGPPFFLQVGYLFLATTEEGLARLEERLALQRSLGVPVERVRLPDGIRGDDVVGAVTCLQDCVADPPLVTRELVRRAAGL